MPFEFDPEALDDALKSEHEQFPLPNYDGFSDVVFEYPENALMVIADEDLRRTYIDALTDLHRLIDEYRFSALLARTLLTDYELKLERGEAERVVLSDDPSFDKVAIPVETVIVMQQYAREPPTAAELFMQPHQQISAGRILSLWFVGQLIDSALYRGIAACDRLAILLRCQAGLPVKVTKRGARIQPSFSKEDLKELEAVYSDFPEWPALREVATDSFFEFIKQERNGFTHERRRPSALHGERPVVYGFLGSEEQEVVGAVDAETHFAMAPAFYNEVLLKAIDATRAVLVASAGHDSP